MTGTEIETFMRSQFDNFVVRFVESCDKMKDSARSERLKARLSDLRDAYEAGARAQKALDFRTRQAEAAEAREARVTQQPPK